MNSAEIKAEIAKLEEEARQILANANFVNGAVQAFHKILSIVEAKEQAVVKNIKNDISEDLTKEADKLEPPKT